MIFEKPIALLRLEGLAVLILSLFIYRQLALSWPLFWWTVLLPDLAFAAYLINPRIGAIAYNLTHAKLLPGLLAVAALTAHSPMLLALALIWFAHIGIDRLLGYGLKYPASFNNTHLGIIGKAHRNLKNEKA